MSEKERGEAAPPKLRCRGGDRDIGDFCERDVRKAGKCFGNWKFGRNYAYVGSGTSEVGLGFSGLEKYGGGNG
jgi:hypothetical protein